MSKLWALTKVLFKTNLFSGNDNSKKKSKKGLSIFVLIVLVAFVMGSLGIPIIFALDSILEVAPLEKVIISLILPLAGITTIIFAVFSVVSVFYLSKDSEYLLPMPISGKDIMMSKFIVSLMNEYYILFMFILPCLIGIGVGIDASSMYYIYTAIIFLFLPVIPSSIVALIILVITKFTGVVKNKDLFMYVSMFLILSFALGYNFIIQEFITIDINNVGATFESLENELLPYFKMIFPFYNSASDALINYDNLNGIFSLVTFISFNFASLLIIYIIGDNLYLKTLTTTSGSKKKNKNTENIKIKNTSVVRMLIKREWTIIKRTPVFMLNIVVIVFLMPIIFCVSFLAAYTMGDEAVMLPGVEQIAEFLDNPMVYFIVLAVVVFFTSFSVAAATAISREGSNAWVMKVIPVSAFKQVSVKVLFASIIDLIGVLIVSIIPIIILKVPVYYVASVLVPLTIIVFLLNYFNIYLDLSRPKIKWSEESVAVKQNMGSLFSILLTIAISAIFALGAFAFYKYNIKINVIVLSGIVSVTCGMILAFVIYLFKKNDNKLLDNVD